MKTHTKTLSFSTIVLAGLLSGLGAGCDGSTATGSGGAGGGAGGAGAHAQGGSGGENVGGDNKGGAGGAAAATAEVVVTLDASKLELPEGLTLSGGDAIVGYAFTGAIEKIKLSDGTRAAFAAAPPPPPNTAFMTGVGLDGAGELYAAYVSFAPDATPGVYSAAPSGGAATLYASNAAMVFPNGFAWDDKGTLFVTDSAYGGVFKVGADGSAEPWISDDLLLGDPPACGAPADALKVGANGLAFSQGALLIASSDQGVLVKVPVLPDGTAGAVEVVAGPDCEKLAGLDGIAIDADGSILGAVNRANRVVRIQPDGSIQTVFEGAPLDFPASVSIAEDGAIYVTSFALGNFLAGDPASPALVRITPGG